MTRGVKISTSKSYTFQCYCNMYISSLKGDYVIVADVRMSVFCDTAGAKGHIPLLL
jgi:hypothetical protein